MRACESLKLHSIQLIVHNFLHCCLETTFLSADQNEEKTLLRTSHRFLLIDLGISVYDVI